MKKIQPQLRYSLSSPPSSGPTARASAPTALQMPTAAARCRPSAKVAEMIASVVGVTSAAPSPCTARLITSTSTLAGEARRQRRGGEDRQPDHEQSFAAPDVRQPAAGQQQAGEHQDVAS